jgi:hypothetical protein
MLNQVPVALVALVALVAMAPACGSSAKDEPQVGAGGNGPGGTKGDGGADGGAAGEGGQASGSDRICDGSSELRFAHAGFDRHLAFFPLEFVQMEPGSNFLYVDGKCNYYTGGGSFEDSAQMDYYRAIEFRTGQLSDEEARELEKLFRYADWASLAGRYGNDQPTMSGGTNKCVHSRRDALCCMGDCSVSAPWLQGVLSDFSDTRLTDTLFNRGVLVDGPVRARAMIVESSRITPQPLALWPLETPFDDVVGTEEDVSQFGHAPLITNPADIALLRAAREEARAREIRERRRIVFRVDDTGEEVIEFAFRETLPFENEAGLISLPPFPQK